MLRSTRDGFTWIEGLVLLGILAVLIALFVPATRRVREASRHHTQINNYLKQVALSVHTYHDTCKQFPPATGSNISTNGKSFPLSILLLPYVEQNPLYQVYVSGTMVMPNRIPSYDAPLDFSTSDWLRVQNFAGNVRVFTDVGIKTSFSAAVPGLTAETGTCTAILGKSFPDGTSNTILFATRFANTGSISSNGDINCSAYDAPLGAGNSAFFGVMPMTGQASAVSTDGWQLAPTLQQVNCQFGAVAHSFGAGGLQVSLADGSVRTISPAMSAFTWNTALQPNDGNPPGSDW